MAEFLFRARPQDFTHPDPNKERAGVIKKGDILSIKEDGHIWGRLEGLPDCVRVKVPGLAVATAKAYMDRWRHEIDFEVVDHNPAIDEYRVRVFVKPDTVKVDGTNGITRNEVENYLTRWNASVHSIAQNEVVFDALIYQAAISQGFWDRDVDLAVFSEVSYDQQATIHNIEVDFSATGWPEDKVAQQIELKGGTVLSNEGNVATFEIRRNRVFNEFKMDVKMKTDDIYMKKRWHISEADVDAIVGAGGEVTSTAAQLQAAIIDKVSE